MRTLLLAPGAAVCDSTSSPASMAALPSVPSVRTRAPSASKLLFSSTKTTKPRVKDPNTAAGAQVGVAARGSSLRHKVTGAALHGFRARHQRRSHVIVRRGRHRRVARELDDVR